MTKKKTTQENPFDVSVGTPAPNKMFTEWQHACTRFLTFRRKVKCAHCGKSRKKHWTQLVFFRVMDGQFMLQPSEQEYAPLTPVCDDHILVASDDVKTKSEEGSQQ